MTKTGAFYTKALGRKVALSANPATVTKIHVISGRMNTWSVAKEGSSRFSRTRLTKSDALIFAKRLARSTSATWVVVHNKNGEVERKLEIKVSSAN